MPLFGYHPLPFELRSPASSPASGASATHDWWHEGNQVTVGERRLKPLLMLNEPSVDGDQQLCQGYIAGCSCPGERFRPFSQVIQ